MSTYSDTVQDSLSKEDTEHLLNKVKFGGLTDEAHALALRELASRGEDISALPSAPVSEQSSAPKYWDLTAEEKLNRRYRLYAIVSILLLVVWTMGCAAFAMDLSHKRGILGIAGGWLVLLAMAGPPIMVSLRAWWTVTKSDDIRIFIGRTLHGFWGLSVTIGLFWFAFGLYGVIAEALK